MLEELLTPSGGHLTAAPSPLLPMHLSVAGSEGSGSCSANQPSSQYYKVEGPLCLAAVIESGSDETLR